MNWLKRLLRGRALPTGESAGQDLQGWRTTSPDGKGMVTVDLDSIAPATQSALRDDIARISGVPPFDGTIEHAYTADHVAQTDHCPRCGAATERKTANFVYATDIAPRAMLAPAGHFCPSCPTVIIDEDMIAIGVKQGFVFRRVVGIDYGDKKRMDVFRTWNGKKPVYILDDNEQFEDLVTHDEIGRVPGSLPPRPRNRKGDKRRKKLAAKARRRNRR